MCKLIKETKQLQSSMEKADPIGSFHHRAAIDFYIEQFKKGKIKAAELEQDNEEYREQYLIIN